MYPILFLFHLSVLMSSDDAGSTSETLCNIGTILNSFSYTDKKLIRRIESLEKKSINHFYAVIFNEKCIKENLLPSFTNITTYDRAVQQSDLTVKYRKGLLEEETRRKKQQLEDIYDQLEEAKASFDALDAEEELKARTREKLSELKHVHDQTVKTRVLKRLSSLYGGSVTLPEKCDNFVNLSSHELTPDQKELLNLGLQCNFYPRANQQEKKAELELLYEQICEKHKAGKIRVNPDVQAQLLSESTKQRGSTKSRLVTPRLREAAKELRNNSDLIIRRADKSSVFVLLDRSDYISKVNVILKDTTKFEKLTRNPIEKQKKDLNAVIDAANAEQGGVKFQRLQGEFSTGYFYGNPKTHKEGAPIRPIISQIPTPAYNVAKQLNSLIAPYVPKTYSLRSSEEFLDILKVRERHGTLASLDASSLFTNVPVDETIGILLENVYSHPSIPAPRVPKAVLRRLLEICTKDTPFRCPEGKLYRPDRRGGNGFPAGGAICGSIHGTG